MAVLPIRNLGSRGVISDMNPVDLPLDAFTDVRNVRFDRGDVRASPVLRQVHEFADPVQNSDSAYIVPRYIHPIQRDRSTIDTLAVVYSDLSIKEFKDGEFNQQANFIGPAKTHTNNKVNSTVLSNVVYFNDNFNSPTLRLPFVQSGQNYYRNLTDFGWDSNWKARVLRSYKDFLIALNMTEDDERYPNRVRWSSAASANEPPTTWDETDVTTAAGFNDFVEMTTPIICGLGLGANFVIYTSDQIWQMEFVGGTFVFNFRKLFENRGTIHQDCAIEVNGRHYVFDREDIYVHDGVTEQSICDGRVRSTIFSNIDLSKTDKFFVEHVVENSEIYFCYHTGRPSAKFLETQCCNEAAVYNYESNTWSFVDLPNALKAGRANLGTITTYDQATVEQYDTIGASYESLDSKYTEYSILLSESDTSDQALDKSRLLAFDSPDQSLLFMPLAVGLNGDAYIERQGIDLDQETSLPLSTYKVIRRVIPILETNANDKTFDFAFGSAVNLVQLPSYDATQTFDLSSDFKIDTRIGGRFLSYKMNASGIKPFRFSGMDLDVVATGRRS